MDVEWIRRFVEKEEGAYESKEESMPFRFLEPFVSQGLNIDLVEPNRLVCSFKIPPRLANEDNMLHEGATAALVDIVGAGAVFLGGAASTGVSVEINVSYVDAAYVGEEIEIEAKVLHVGKSIGVVSVELRKKETGKVIAQGHHSKYLPVSSKL